ncbi:AAA family ATPase [Desulfogranum mediterraneum]|uniref:AAA family ATPase n=1 Tax=Desulfogranum mediterraneum TaxID=160661 RepID=UPI0003FDFE82|nr:AAA family ATPase [Desulfogranum mediterraneum]
MITRLNLKSFCAFKELEIEFSPRINVIIGENSCGKTKLLKAAYLLTSTAAELYDKKSVLKADVAQLLTEKLLGIYKPAEEKIGSLKHLGDKEKAEIRVDFTTDISFGAIFSARSQKAIPIGDYKNTEPGGGVFLPTKEVLSFLDGMTDPESHPPTVNRLFDSTYLDLVGKLLNPEEITEEKAQWAMEKVCNRIGGRFEFEGSNVLFKPGIYKEYKNQHTSETYFSPQSTSSFSTTMTAEGYRKIGVLQRLLQNSKIGTGTNGPLYWDEPEANLNPQLMKMIVDVLLELSRSGQQIIIATHEYILLKWFDLLMDKKGKGDLIKFHTLYHDEDGQVKIESTDNYKMLNNNSIALTYNEIYDAEIERSLGNADND